MTTSGSGAESGRRTLDLLFAFERSPVASVRQLAEASGIPTPSAHRYVAMLREMGIVEDVDRGTYRLTMRVVALAHAARRATTLIELVTPHMKSLAEELGETVLFVQPIAGSLVCTHRFEAHRNLRLSFEVGQNLPPLRGASAHLYVGSLPAEQRRAYVQSMLARGAAAPIPDEESFLAAASDDSERGWAVSHDEIDEGVWACAAALADEQTFIGTLSVPVPSFRVDTSRADEIVDAAVRHAAQIVSTLSGAATVHAAS